MVLKGNLLYNGDFEAGTTEGWEINPFGLSNDYTLSVNSSAKLRGNYGGWLETATSYGTGFIAYDKICSFEEHEGYLYILPIKMEEGVYCQGYLYGLDDKGNLIDKFILGYNSDKGSWRRITAFLRGYRDITHFKVGAFLFGSSYGGLYYIDEAKLMPLKSIKSHVLAETRDFDNVTSDKIWYSGLACIGRCQLRSIVEVTNVSGTSPTLDISVEVFLFEGVTLFYKLSHSQFTSEGYEEKVWDLPEACYIRVTYDVGGTSPSFDIYHYLRLYPY